MRLERRLGQVEAQLGSTKHLEARLERLERRMTSFKHSVSTPFNSGRLGAKIKNSQEAMVRCTLEAWTFLTKIMRERRLASPQPISEEEEIELLTRAQEASASSVSAHRLVMKITALSKTDQHKAKQNALARRQKTMRTETDTEVLQSQRGRRLRLADPSALWNIANK